MIHRQVFHNDRIVPIEQVRLSPGQAGLMTTYVLLEQEDWFEDEIGFLRKTLRPGDVQVIQRGVKHKFWTKTGAIFEEISTTHFNDDSLYEDPKIAKMPREERKTKLTNWGRHQFD